MYQLGSAACSHGLVRTAWAGPIAAAYRQSVLGAAGTRRARVTPAAGQTLGSWTFFGLESGWNES